ncbi:CbtA family protein [Pseudomonas gingeri]|uniref:CbtA family protein n=1 Tax=Pseudomonas gingeri TaxID=117681 RepID=UPI0015A48F37|nr:CbtA family protein [Pseudomonas gingeri]NVZ26727.1 CbtA family protein [Pseudomonas gingeri]
MTGSLLLRGMLVGLVAGLLAFGFAKVFGEPQVDKAIAFEEKMDAMKGEAPEPELVSRETQSSIGLLTGVLVYSASMGGLFALVFAYSLGRVGRMGPRGLSALLALAAFVAVIFVPELKYPANPPSVGDPDTIKQRTKLFFLMLAVSIAAMVIAINLGRKLIARHGAWTATLVGAALYVMIAAVAHYAFPEINEVPADFSAVVLWQFRVAALGIQLVLWTTLGLLFGWLTERALKRQGHYVLG